MTLCVCGRRNAHPAWGCLHLSAGDDCLDLLRTDWCWLQACTPCTREPPYLRSVHPISAGPMHSCIASVEGPFCAGPRGFTCTGRSDPPNPNGTPPIRLCRYELVDRVGSHPAGVMDGRLCPHCCSRSDCGVLARRKSFDRCDFSCNRCGERPSPCCSPRAYDSLAQHHLQLERGGV